jgi:aminomethyltransferase
LEARLSFVVKFNKGDFIGREALLKQKEEGVKRRRVGVLMLKKGIPRAGFGIYKENKKIGYITSGTFSPLLKRGIGMAYVQIEHSEEETEVTIEIQQRKTKAKIVRFPFYDTEKYGYRRKT